MEPTEIFNSIVAIGYNNEFGRKEWIGTGFFYGVPSPVNENSTVFLVTNEHVVKDSSGNVLLEVYIKCNPDEDGHVNEYKLNLKNNPPIFHPKENIDVALIFPHIEGRLIPNLNIIDHSFALKKEDIKSLGIYEGELVHVAGFPASIATDHSEYMIVRLGTIAQIRNLLIKNEDEFLVDAFIFLGNSGGPVFLKRERINGQNMELKLIGFVHSYYSFSDNPLRQETDQITILFRENSGLSAAHPIDVIDETFTAFREQIVESFQRILKKYHILNEDYIDKLESVAKDIQISDFKSQIDENFGDKLPLPIIEKIKKVLDEPSSQEHMNKLGKEFLKELIIDSKETIKYHELTNMISENNIKLLERELTKLEVKLKELNVDLNN